VIFVLRVLLSLALIVGWGHPALAKPSELSVPADPYGGGEPDSIWSNAMKRPGKRRGSAVWFPLLSYVAPGIGQFLNGQSGAGFVYSGVATLGLGSAVSAAVRLSDDPRYSEASSDIDSFDPLVRQFTWGLKTYDLAGSLSLYHSFQTTLLFRKQQGDFQFLPAQAETTDQLMLAPFDFSYLGRWSTLIPLALGAGFAVWSGATDDFDTRSLNTGDIAFAGGLSYNAGVGEEALFRGWMFPLFVEAYGVENIFWANLTQAAIFGVAHYSDQNRLPWFQFLAGYYFGWLAKKNGWSLREAIFVHKWWNVIVFSAAFTQRDRKASLYVPLYQTQF
jgi:membrane protease YdiL (CAAX protease family)